MLPNYDKENPSLERLACCISASRSPNFRAFLGFGVSDLGLWGLGLGFRVWGFRGLGCRVTWGKINIEALLIRIKALGYIVVYFGFGVSDLGLWVLCLGFRIWGFGFGVWGFGFGAWV